MRNKNTIIALLVVFSAICVFNLFMTRRAFSMEAEVNGDSTAIAHADEIRAQEGWRETYEQAQRNAFSLGLDLQGGLFVTMEVGVEDILREYAGNSGRADKKFEMAIEMALKEKETSQDNMVDIFYRSLQKVYENEKVPVPVNQTTGDKILLSRYFSSQSKGIASNDPDPVIIEKLKASTDAAINNTFTIIRSRIDQFGVASPNLQLQSGTGRILLELPGVKDPSRVKRLLRNTAKLEFRETVPYPRAKATLYEIDKVVKRLEGLEKGETPVVDNAPQPVDTTAKVASEEGATEEGATEEAVADATTTVEDTNAKSTSVNEMFDNNGTATAATDDSATAAAGENQSMEAFMADHPFLALLSPDFQFRGDNPLCGLVSISDTSKVNKWLNHPEVKAIIPFSIKFLWEAKPDGDLKDQFKGKLGLIAVASNRDDKAPLEGNAIVSARQDYEPNTTNAMVNMTMNNEGGRTWARLTKDNIGNCVAIVLDDYVQSYPRVNGVISGGRSQITGNFSVEEAKDLANLLQAGSLPVKAKILGDSQVGPTLGAENLSRGLVSFLVAFAMVILFMGYYYRGSGWVANIALIVNLFYILGVSAALNVVFTLPGLAAVVLTMGMAVDANVLIFERIREEMALGKSYKAAVAAGFKNAFSTVMDSNITTFLTGLILFSFGIGPIAGFAVNLMIGIVTSLICALFITRIILEYFGDRNPEGIKLGSTFTINVFNKIDIKMTKRKKAFYAFSAGLTVLSLVSIAVWGFKTGVDFDGGRQVKVSFDKSVTPEEVRTPLTAAFGNTAPLIRNISGENTLLITTKYKGNDQTGSTEFDDLVKAELEKASPGSNPKIVESILVGPTVANDIKISAIYSVGFSLLIIFLYILIRFRKYQYSLGALACLFHDVSIVLGIFSFFGHFEILPFSLEIDQAFIAAILTVIGYSINDTVIVFDRIRENLGEMKAAKLGEVYDKSINQTVSRTLITSGTTMLTILVMFFFAGDVIRAFMFALLVGIFVGTYSSVFVASPISYDLLVAAEGEEVSKMKGAVTAKS